MNMAVQRLSGIAQVGSAACVSAPFAIITILDLLLHARALCIQKARGESVIRVGGDNRSLGHGS
jgi:hypothetical protein